LRRALLLSKGDPMVLLTRPISCTMLILAAALLTLVLLPSFSATREEAFKEG
jgi:putative tricarboxylic transport membrane protein